MSVSLDRAKEVLLGKMVSYIKETDRLSHYDEDQLNEENLGELYSDLSWGDFSEKTGVVDVDQWGGEGEGERYGYVLRFDVDGEEVFLKVTGHYDSWNGIDWDYGDVSLVRPVQKTITVYE